MAGTVLIGAQPASAVNADGSVELKAATGKCLEVVPDASGNFFVTGNRIQQRTCDGAPQQQWFLDQLPGAALVQAPSGGATPHSGAVISGPPRPIYHIVNRMTLQCLDDMDGRTTNRNPVQQWTCNGDTSMVWVWDEVYEPSTLGARLINMKAGKCLDVTDGSFENGARLQIYNCFDPGNAAQHYTKL
ncbi:RICIN domain-containing protein [Streptosporangiaceae bacterium NEAU-GS5]|nr:RICIN domain-containing protein [Streptosporangiaceae bacterium NEAU-GS5]